MPADPLSELNPEAVEKPTTVRYQVLAVTTLMAVLLYLDRYCISIAEIYISQDLGLTEKQMGWVLGAFFGAYALGQVPAGWLTDRFGPRWMLTCFILLWSLFTGLTGLATGFVMLFVLRIGFGFAQAGAYPTAASLLSVWSPLSQRGTASSIVAMGGRVGGALAPLLTALLIVQLVPISVSSRIGVDDMLDVPRLCHEIEQEADDVESAGARIWARLVSQDTRRLIEHYAGLWSATESAGASHAEDAAQIPSHHARRLAHQLDALLEDPGFYDASAFQGKALSREAETLLARGPQQLSPAKLARFNRLVLEAVFPRSLRRVYCHGWRDMMWIYGALGLLVAGLFWSIFRNSPGRHPRCNAAEVELIERGKVGPRADQATRTGVPLLGLVTSGSMWLNCFSQFGINVGWVFLVTWLPRYLDQEHGVPIEMRAVMTMLPLWAACCGGPLGGLMTDAMTRRLGLRWGRVVPMASSKVIAMAAFLTCYLVDLPAWGAVAMFTLASFAVDLGVPAIWAYCQDVGGRNVGSVLGWGNMWGNFGAMVGPPLVIYFVGDGETKNWDQAFLISAVAFFLSGVAALGIDATKPIRTRGERAAESDDQAE